MSAYGPFLDTPMSRNIQPWRRHLYVPPADIPPRDLIVLIYYPHYFGEDFDRDIDLRTRMGVPVRCRFIYDREAIDNVDAVLMHLPSSNGPAPRKRVGQKWVAMNMESARNYPDLFTEERLRRFDITMTYRRDSDVPATYFYGSSYGDFKGDHIHIPRVTDPAPVLYLASNPVPKRDAYVRELSKYIEIASYGKCLNNRNWNDLAGALDTAQPEQSLIAAYPFYLAFENSRSEDYVTEKLLRALAVGTIPIYRGAPNVKEFLPDPDAIITPNDFDTPAHLAAYLYCLLMDASSMNKHLAWRTRPWPPEFEALVSVGSVPSQERLAIKLAHDCGRECCCGGRLL